VLDPEGVGAADVSVGVDRSLVPPLRVSRDERRIVTGPCIGQQDTHRPCMPGSIILVLCMAIGMGAEWVSIQYLTLGQAQPTSLQSETCIIAPNCPSTLISPSRYDSHTLDLCRFVGLSKLLQEFGVECLSWYRRLEPLSA
jgi:hypothetical protein